jgi:hypothetical protein
MKLTLFPSHVSWRWTNQETLFPNHTPWRWANQETLFPSDVSWRWTNQETLFPSHVSWRWTNQERLSPSHLPLKVLAANEEICFPKVCQWIFWKHVCLLENKIYFRHDVSKNGQTVKHSREIRILKCFRINVSWFVKGLRDNRRYECKTVCRLCVETTVCS